MNIKPMQKTLNDKQQANINLNLPGANGDLERMQKTLNEKQQAYVNLNLPNAKNGEYLLTVFHFKPGKDLNTLQEAAEIAAESSTGTNFKVKTETPFSREMNALVYKVDLDHELVWIAYP